MTTPLSRRRVMFMFERRRRRVIAFRIVAQHAVSRFHARHRRFNQMCSMCCCTSRKCAHVRISMAVGGANRRSVDDRARARSLDGMRINRVIVRKAQAHTLSSYKRRCLADVFFSSAICVRYRCARGICFFFCLLCAEQHVIFVRNNSAQLHRPKLT